MIFDRYIIVDWSATSGRPRGRADTVWFCELYADGARKAENSKTRGIARRSFAKPFSGRLA